MEWIKIAIIIAIVVLSLIAVIVTLICWDNNRLIVLIALLSCATSIFVYSLVTADRESKEQPSTTSCLIIEESKL